MSEISATKKNLSVFSLVRTKKDCYYPPVSADYTPLKGYSQFQLSLNQTEQSILPKFNLDQNFFTPAFINPYENIRLKENSVEAIDKEREKFLKKIQSYDYSNIDEVTYFLIQEPMFNPRDDNYCSLCKSSFKCYWAHVNSKSHSKHIKGNKFNSYIHELCKKIERKDKHVQDDGSEIRQEVTKKKKISKCHKKSKQRNQGQVFKREDFIVKLPSDLFEKEVQNINYNTSTNGLNSLQQNLLKI